jgi:hypothetical protein
MGMRRGGMCQDFQGAEGFFRLEGEQLVVSLDHFKVKGGHSIEQGLIGRKPIGLLGVIRQALCDRGDRFCHSSLLLATCASLLLEYSIAGTCFQQASGSSRRTSPHRQGSIPAACGGLKPFSVRSGIYSSICATRCAGRLPQRAWSATTSARRAARNW